MKVYTISPERAHAEKIALRKRMLVISAICLASTTFLPITLISHGWGPALRVWVPAALIVTLCGVLMTRRVSRFEDELCATFELTWDGETLSRKQKNSPDVALSTSEITAIEERQGMGFRIRTRSWSKNIWVPCELDEYDAFKAAISAKTGVAVNLTRNAWTRTYARVVFYLAGAMIALFASNRLVAAAAGFAVAAAFFWFFGKQVRSPNLTARGRRMLWLSLVLWLVFLLVVVVRLLSQKP
jgi:hypothetical protein